MVTLQVLCSRMFRWCSTKSYGIKKTDFKNKKTLERYKTNKGKKENKTMNGTDSKKKSDFFHFTGNYFNTLFLFFKVGFLFFLSCFLLAEMIIVLTLVRKCIDIWFVIYRDVNININNRFRGSVFNKRKIKIT